MSIQLNSLIVSVYEKPARNLKLNKQKYCSLIYLNGHIERKNINNYFISLLRNMIHLCFLIFFFVLFEEHISYEIQ